MICKICSKDNTYLIVIDSVTDNGLYVYSITVILTLSR